MSKRDTVAAQIVAGHVVSLTYHFVSLLHHYFLCLISINCCFCY